MSVQHAPPTSANNRGALEGEAILDDHAARSHHGEVITQPISNIQ
jgi:dihydroxy-acid dehydratase